ncbi:glycosyltransferase family 2 protein [Luteimonas sp. gir]|uniref:glycosyltransferase family 2 protein n=1 Tax=Luteimonas sp. gir TaxID=3127960 RepID=UPI003075E75D
MTDSIIPDGPHGSPLVSVVIPSYNRAHIVCAAVRSALDQAPVDLEVIVVDDGSNDDTERQLEELADPRVRYIRQPNAGACVARNTGMLAARGHYIALLDSDDVFLPGHLASAVELLSRSTEKTVVYGRITVDRGNGVSFEKPPRAIRPGEPVSEYLLCDTGFVQTSTVVLRRDLAQRVLYTPGLPFGQDTDFAIRLGHEGATFHMLKSPQAVWLDVADEGRVSSKLDPIARERWLASVQDAITPRALAGDRGWFVAKGHAARNRHAKAAVLFLGAVVRGCYRPKVAARIFLQIFLPKNVYRVVADRVIAKQQRP